MRRAPLDPQEMPADAQVGARFGLPDRSAHYLRDVLRMDRGARVELFDGDGRLIEAELVDVSPDGVVVRIESDQQTERGESPCAITLVQAIAKGKRFETALKKATELGVRRFIPLESRRTVVHISQQKIERKVARWTRVVEACARQCRRSHTPTVTAPMDVDQALEDVATMPAVVGHPDASAPSVAGALAEAGWLERRPAEIALWIGPEGGFDEAEIAGLVEAGCRPAHFGPRVLRAETAGIVGVGLLQTFVGDLS